MAKKVWAGRIIREGVTAKEQREAEREANETLQDSAIPRRIRIDQQTPAEAAIRAAIAAVEALPADVRLTNAVISLQAARESVADYVDGVTKEPGRHGRTASRRLSRAASVR